MMYPIKHVTMAVLSTLILSGCATHSDQLGFVEGESTKTYAEAYAPARKMLMTGQFDALLSVLNENSTQEIEDETQTEDGEVRRTVRQATLTNDEEMERLINEQSELAIIERGLLTLNTGHFERALFYFDAAEEKLNRLEAQEGMASVASTASRWGKTGLSALIGTEELAEYQLRGYEKVMLLNYKALCYMLMGDRRAYNVTRRAIDVQQEEWEKFKALVAENNNEKTDLTAEDVDDRSDEVKAKAQLVTSAYVNPFADYLNAMMMEIDGFDDPTMRENARIAYQKVVKNNRDCEAARSAVKSVTKGIPKNQKLVQVLLSDGFAPIQVEKTKVYPIRVDSNRTINAVVNYANATPINSPTTGARIFLGKKANKLTSLTKMESLILRDEADRLPMRATMIALALLRSSTAGAFLGDLGSSLAATIQRPDTRSWMTLPNQVYVARLAVPKNQSHLKLETLDADGNVIAKANVKLAKSGPTVVYGVSYGENIRTYANAFSWIN